MPIEEKLKKLTEDEKINFIVTLLGSSISFAEFLVDMFKDDLKSLPLIVQYHLTLIAANMKTFISYEAHTSIKDLSGNWEKPGEFNEKTKENIERVLKEIVCGLYETFKEED